jgi:hypothetical protein
MKKLIVVLMPMILFGGLLAFTKRGHTQTPAAQSSVEDDALKKVIREQGLRGAARLKGHYVGELRARNGSYDLQDLTQGSALIVVGTPLRNKVNIDEEGDLITTDYDVVINEAVKGNVSQGSIIEVSLPGGRVEFPDGTSAEQRTPDLRKIDNGKRYVLFLHQRRPGTAEFAVTGGQGIFEIPDDGSGIKPHGSLADPAAAENKDKPVALFLQQVRDAAKKWPEPPACCS